MAKPNKDITSRKFKNKLRSSYSTSIISISLVLFMIGLIGLMLLNANRLSDYVKENIGFSVILKDNLKEIEIIRLQKDLDATHYVKSTEYIPKERAAKEFQEDLGENFVDFLGYNPLLASIEVKLHASYANKDSIQIIENDLNAYSQIKEVYYQKNLVEMVNENVKQISLYLFVFSLLFLLISIVLINNTVRLSVYSKRFLINTMKLIGATNGYIRRPHLFNAVLQGLFSAIVAIFLLLGAVDLMQGELEGTINFGDYRVLAILFAGIMIIGFLITFIAAYFAVSKYLRLRSDELYF